MDIKAVIEDKRVSGIAIILMIIAFLMALYLVPLHNIPKWNERYAGASICIVK